MRIVRKILILLVVTLPSLSVNAALVSRDLYLPGDGLVTFDTETKIEWLSQSVCAAFTLGELDQCGLPSGFAPVGGSESAANEIIPFLENAGVDALFFDFSPALIGTNATYLAYQQLLNLNYFGSTSTGRLGGVGTIIGVFGEVMPIYDFFVDEAENTAYVVTLSAIAYHPEWSAEGIGIVRVVTIPAAAWLFGSAMLGLIGLARRKKA